MRRAFECGRSSFLFRLGPTAFRFHAWIGSLRFDRPGIGWSWGRGDVSFQGKTYRVKVEGLSVAEVGVTRAEASGNVYNLKSVEDLNGVYAAASAEGTAGKGVGYSSLRNDKGVVINLKSETKGANLKIAASGLKFTVEPSQ